MLTQRCCLACTQVCIPNLCPAQVVFLPNYNVSEAEIIIPGAELRCS